MTRALAASLVALGLLAAACNKTEDAVGVDVETGSGGKRAPIKSDPPASTGGKSGSGGGAGTAGSGGAVGSGGTAAGGAAAAGGAGGSDAGDDAPPATGAGGSASDGGAPVDAPAASGDSGLGAFDDGALLPVAGKEHIRLCQKDWDKAKCCEFLCRCMNALCTDSPMDKGRIPMCMSVCMGVDDARARCLVYHCFESKNPKAIPDHASHCGHASGRVGGGGCPKQ